MANAEHLEILKQGVEVWNEWREENKDVITDLSGADLSGLNLSEALFHFTNLDRVNFDFANLTNALLSNATLTRANFSNTNLSQTNFFRAYLDLSFFSKAHLEGACFEEANLANSMFIESNVSNVNFSAADLMRVNFSDVFLCDSTFFEANLAGAFICKGDLKDLSFRKCYIEQTTFALTDLSTVRNLETVKVSGQCSIDFQTLNASKNLPKTFLQKIGLPENYINYLPDFFDEKPIRMHPAFLSHSWQDKPFATKLYEALIKRNVLVWYDERKLVPGDDIREGISKGIDLYDKFILVCSKHSLQASWWVDKELNRALDKELRLFKEKGRQVNTIIPITIDDYVHQEWDSAKRSDIQRYVIGDFKDWQDDAKFEKALEALVAALNADRGEDKVPSYL